MTISSSVSTVTRDGNGAATSFSFPFKVWDTTQLAVFILNAAGEATETTNWTATLADPDPGGSVTYPAVGGTVLPTGWKIVINRNMPLTQEVDLVNATAFNPEVIEEALDSAIATIQQVFEEVGRSVRVDPGNTDAASYLTEVRAAVVSTAADAATATTQAGLATTNGAAQVALAAAQVALAEDAKDAAEDAAASIPTFEAFGLTLAGTTTASNARAELGLGTAALLDAGTGVGDVPVLDAGGKLDSGVLPTTDGIDEIARDVALANAIRLGRLAGDASGVIPSGYLYMLLTDELATKTGASYEADTDSYVGFSEILGGAGTPVGGMTAGGGLAASWDGDNDKTYAESSGSSPVSAGYVEANATGKDWGVDVTKTIVAFRIKAPSNSAFHGPAVASGNVRLYGSNTNFAGAVSLGTFTTTGTSGEELYVTSGITTTNPYRFHWIVFSGGGTYYTYCAQVTFYEAAAMTLIPTAITPGEAATSVRMLLWYKDVSGGSVLNTDIKIRATADDGTNWSDFGVIESLGDISATWTMLKVEITGMTPGTSVKWEITTPTGKWIRVGPSALVYGA